MGLEHFFIVASNVSGQSSRLGWAEWLSVSKTNEVCLGISTFLALGIPGPETPYMTQPLGVLVIEAVTQNQTGSSGPQLGILQSGSDTMSPHSAQNLWRGPRSCHRHRLSSGLPVLLTEPAENQGFLQPFLH